MNKRLNFTQIMDDTGYNTGTCTLENHPPLGCHVSAANTEKTIRRIVQQIKLHDSLRIKLERNGGIVADLEHISRILSEPLQLETPYGYPEKGLNLMNPSKLHRLLKLHDSDLHFQVRQLHTQFPVYYICRMNISMIDFFLLQYVRDLIQLL